MNVKLVVQTLSNSIHKSFMFLMNLPDDNVRSQFQDCFETANFCLQFNNIGDVLNCKNKYSKHEFNTPLTEDNYKTMQMHAKHFEQYITSLCDENNTSILKTNRKTGFLGLIICLKNIYPLFQKLKILHVTYLLTYKLSQDYLEMFFSAIRARGGFNNNPNALQIKSAYRRLLIRNELREFENGNCLFDGIDILHVTSRPKNIICSIGNPESLNETIMFDQQYVASLWDLPHTSTTLCNTLLDSYVTNFSA